MSIASPGGTFVEAYDTEGELIARIPTDAEGFEFAGFESNIPVAAVRIAPVTDIDPDFAFDDVMFDRPAAIMR